MGDEVMMQFSQFHMILPKGRKGYSFLMLKEIMMYIAFFLKKMIIFKVLVVVSQEYTSVLPFGGLLPQAAWPPLGCGPKGRSMV